jgi:endonuclease G
MILGMRSKIFFLTALLFSFSIFSAEEIVHKANYTLSYNEDHEVANWVSYELDHEKLQNCVKRKNAFRPDPDISTGSAVASDYKGSGYDRGHLVPAGDMKHTKQAMSETFFFSNMTPQPASFNQGPWSTLEHLMRSWGLKYKKIWIVTGPILEDNLPYIGSRNQVSIPNAYYKLILKQSGNSYEGIAFLMPTNATSKDMKRFVTSINTIEEMTGFDFFQHLDDKIEEQVESQMNISRWDFSGKFEYLPCRTSVAQ